MKLLSAITPSILATSTDSSHDRLVWKIPEKTISGGCISGWCNKTGVLLWRSDEQHLDLDALAPHRRLGLTRRDSIANAVLMNNSTGVDNPKCSSLDAAAAKRKNMAIVGAGMAGLMTYLCLTQQGLSNVNIIEAGDRLGGRVHTVYLSGGPFDYSYQEMGPMRVPITLTVANQTYKMSDHELVFQLVDELNRINNDSKDLNLDFITWHESGAGRLPHGGGSLRVGELLSPQGPVKQSDSRTGNERPSLSVEQLFDRVNKCHTGPSL
ncbi:hypothetical protein QBC35DRAFT_542611 [Podospora australis]|uniref:Amine oxidase domain-containing protein n=1 Tax=Podospora australis TaxID=1536484 RepID=A0AAN6WKN2_9PEZI|nr:hypothetical protein QBC35DRAFT_542611 [Podospora australis]